MNLAAYPEARNSSRHCRAGRTFAPEVFEDRLKARLVARMVRLAEIQLYPDGTDGGNRHHSARAATVPTKTPASDPTTDPTTFRTANPTLPAWTRANVS